VQILQRIVFFYAPHVIEIFMNQRDTLVGILNRKVENKKDTEITEDNW
jgi:hypothetical protein